MKKETEIDELIFWKRFVDEKEEWDEKVSEQFYKLLEIAEIKMLLHLMDKYGFGNNMNLPNIISSQLKH